jgi:hypothetical protein
MDYKIPINWQKFTDNPVIRTIQDKFGALPGSGKPPSDSAGVREIHDQLNGLIGERGPYVTTDTMDSAATRAEGTMDAVANRTTLKGDQTFNNGLDRIESIARLSGDDGTSAVDAIQKLRDQFATTGTSGPGTMTGQEYRDWTQAKNGTFANLTGGTQRSDRLIHQVEDQLDNLFHRSASPGDAADLSDALTKYRIIKTLQPAVETSAGTGVLSPTSLDNSVTRQSHRWDASTGGIAYGGPDNPDLKKLSDLADIYKVFLGPTKASQVGSEGKGVSGGIGALAGAGGLETAGHYLGATPGLGTSLAVAGLSGNRILQNFVRSPQVAQNIVQSSVDPMVRQAAELRARLLATQATRAGTLSGLPQTVPGTVTGLLGY